jgi:glycosyltransferase involved in cell wall biosynthesis
MLQKILMKTTGKKLKVLFQTDSPLAKTGFGRNAKALLSYLYKTGKYDISQYCCSTAWSDPNLKRVPWEAFGVLPDDKAELNQISQNPQINRTLGYGEYNIDKAVKRVKPDVVISVQDIWGIDFTLNKPWFDKTHNVYWTTLDSLPIIPSAENAAKKIKNFWVWSNFAEKDMNKRGFNNVKTMHGCIEAKDFKKLPLNKRQELRHINEIPQDAFIVGFVFRNQLRKSVPNLIEGFAEFQKQNPKSNSKLLLHTSWQEGWNIHRLADQYGVNKSDILTTHVCNKCTSYEVREYKGEKAPCKFCGGKDTMVTTGVGLGVSEEQLCEVYNLMDVYCHPFTSGGQEIPIQEAKLCELVTLVTNYSCGEEMCEEDAASLSLDWDKYTEHITEFIKASTKPFSIAKNLSKVFKMKPESRSKMGQQARQWVLDHFSTEAVGKQFEEFLDALEPIEYDFDAPPVKQDPDFVVPNIEDNREWLLCMYENILKRTQEDIEGVKYWLNQLSQGTTREDIEKYFKQVAAKENAENFPTQLKDSLDEDDAGNRLLFVMPKSIGDVYWATSLLPSIKNQYPEYNLYFATEKMYFDMLGGNEFIHKVIPYHPSMENLLALEGAGDNQGLFEVVFLPHLGVQKIFDYQHNGKSNIQFDLCTF